MLIAIEGIDGTGKATQCALLRKTLKNCGKTSGLYSFPRYEVSEGGSLVRSYLNGEFGDLAPKVAAGLFALDRFECRELLQLAVGRQDVVICDRYVSSNVAHQCAREKVRSCQKTADMLGSWIYHLEYVLYRLPRPDLTILLKTDPELSMRAAADRGETDFHESDVRHQVEAQEQYLILAKKFNWVVIDTVCRELTDPLQRHLLESGDRYAVPVVAGYIWNALHERFPQTFPETLMGRPVHYV